MNHRDGDNNGEYEVTGNYMFTVMATCLSVGDVPKWYWVFKEGIHEPNKCDMINYMFKMVSRLNKRRQLQRVILWASHSCTDPCVLGHASFSMTFLRVGKVNLVILHVVGILCYWGIFPAFFFLPFTLRQGLSKLPSLPWNLLCRSGWSWTCNPLALASGIQYSTTRRVLCLWLAYFSLNSSYCFDFYLSRSLLLSLDSSKHVFKFLFILGLLFVAKFYHGEDDFSICISSLDTSQASRYFL